MQMIIKQDNYKMQLMPLDTQDNAKRVKVTIPHLKITGYLKKEPGEKDYTGFTTGRAGIAYRIHLVRNGATAPHTLIVQPQDDPLPKEYKLLLTCNDERGLPLLNTRTNETYRVPNIVFETAHECAEYEDYLRNTMDNPPKYTVTSWQEGNTIDTAADVVYDEEESLTNEDSDNLEGM